LPTFSGLQLYLELMAIDNSLMTIVLTASQEAVEIINPSEGMVINKPIFPFKLAEQVRMMVVRNTLSGLD
jgi:hypothetical protein